MGNQPRELTRTLTVTPENIPITDITSDEAGGRGTGGGGRNPTDRESSLDQEVVTLTQRQLTSEFEAAEMNNLRVEAEVGQRHVEQELSQEIHMLPGSCIDWGHEE